MMFSVRLAVFMTRIGLQKSCMQKCIGVALCMAIDYHKKRVRQLKGVKKFLPWN